MTCRIGDASCASAHAATLNRATDFHLARAGQSLLQLQRQCGNHYVQRALAQARKGEGGAWASPDVEQAVQRACSGGQALDSAVRAQMEPTFGADFGGVRVHADAGADALNQSLNARAFTTGQDIFFRQGAYSPGSSSGRELLAHELTHVVQQTSDQVRRKLTVGQPEDIYEQEAERVMQVPDPATRSESTGTVSPCPSSRDEIGETLWGQNRPFEGPSAPWLQRQVSKAEIEDELVKAFLGTSATVQRQINEPEVVEEEKEEKLMQAKPAGGLTRPVGTGLEVKIRSFEPTQMIQQRQEPLRKIQRRIMVGGKPYTPSTKYYAYLDNKFGPHMKEFIKKMHNDGNPPDFTFSSYEQMGFEVQVRHQAIKGIKAVHSGCCNYFDSAHPDYLDSTYWDRVGSMHFKPKSPLPPGKKASDAIEAIFAPGAGTRLECLSMTVAVEYYSLLKGLGKAKFNALFPGGAGIEISTSPAHLPLFLGAARKYKITTVANKNELLPGDWVYFKNFSDYLVKHPGGYWKGENAIYLGDGKYRGFGIPSLTESNMNAELVAKYNAGLPAADQKSVTDLIADGGGLRLDTIVRPEIAKLTP